jgi:hypothetical protein
VVEQNHPFKIENMSIKNEVIKGQQNWRYPTGIETGAIYRQIDEGILNRLMVLASSFESFQHSDAICTALPEGFFDPITLPFCPAFSPFPSIDLRLLMQVNLPEPFRIRHSRSKSRSLSVFRYLAPIRRHSPDVLLWC